MNHEHPNELAHQWTEYIKLRVAGIAIKFADYIGEKTEPMSPDGEDYDR